MKFVLNINQFSPNIKEVDLTEKEVDYIVMLASGVQDEKIKELLNINHSELEVLYQKFGLTNKQRVRDLQLTTVMAMNNLITPELIMHTKERFNLIELKEMIDFYKKNDILYVKYIDTSKNYTSYTILDKTNVVSLEILNTSNDLNIPAKIPDELKDKIGLKFDKILQELKNTKYSNILDSLGNKKIFY